MEIRKIKGIIKLGPAKITEYGDKKQIAFQLIDHDNWFNVVGEQEALEAVMLLLIKGNLVEFQSTDHGIASEINVIGIATKIKVLETSKKETTSQTSKEISDSIVKIQGKDYMTYRGLLSKAHGKDPDFSMELTESWVSPDMTMAWCKVRLTSKKQIFDGFGSSTPKNTGALTQTHPVEMSQTRAKGRALRDFLNIGEVMAEELK